VDATRYAEADIPTPFGPFRLVVYKIGAEEHVALVCGDVVGQADVCRAQLDAAMAAIAAAGRGVIVYLRQEGRGIGLGNKIRAYALQAEGKDTVEANLALGFAADMRSYDMAAAILGDLGASSVALMTNNPDKLAGLEQAGVKVDRHVPHWVGDHEHNKEYLEVKRAKMGHIK
jgi:GTP cyclohydrolase II